MKFTVKDYISRVDRQRRVLQSLEPFDERELNQLNEMSRIREVYSSNAIEGNSYTESETKYTLETGNAIGGKSVKEGLEVLNLNRTIKMLDGMLKRHMDLTESLILNIHQCVTSGILDDIDDSGQYKNRRNWIGGASIHTSTPQATPNHMKKLMEWYDENKNILHPIELAIRFKYRFICIHPFVDGNGRVSRLITNFILKKQGYLPLIIDPKINKDKYYEALENSHEFKDKFSCDPLIKFSCLCLEHEYRSLLSFINDEDEEE